MKFLGIVWSFSIIWIELLKQEPFLNVGDRIDKLKGLTETDYLWNGWGFFFRSFGLLCILLYFCVCIGILLHACLCLSMFACQLHMYACNVHLCQYLCICINVMCRYLNAFICLDFWYLYMHMWIFWCLFMLIRSKQCFLIGVGLDNQGT